MSVPRLTRPSTPRHGVGIVHLGPGAFFRAFNAVYTHHVMAACGGDWAIRAISLRSADIRDQLHPQGCAYTSVTMVPDGSTSEVIDSISEVLVAPEDPAVAVAAMADPAVSIVSMTITEKGYCHHPATGKLRLDDPDVAFDLEHPAAPRTAPGLIVRALEARKLAGARPFTVLSCDNLPNNGRLIRGVVLEFADRINADLAAWIDTECRFPATMVDRITPATTSADIDRLTQATGLVDQACVFHEPFRQWVIEDDFVDGRRPDWDVAGAQFVRDVAPFEAMKLRLLNGTHSSLAYLGYLAGKETISDTIADPDFAAFCQRLWHTEILPTVPPPETTDLVAYCAALMTRYANPAIRHRTWQIAMDGSQKLPQRILGTIRDNLAAGRPIDGLALAVAGWMVYVGGVDEQGERIDVRDPLADRLRSAVGGHQTAADNVSALLAVKEIFDPDLAANKMFRSAVTAAFEGLAAHGAAAMVSRAAAR